jgi:dUTPase
MIPFRVKKLTKTAKEPHRNRESDLWDLYADDFCVNHFEDGKVRNEIPFNKSYHHDWHYNKDDKIITRITHFCNYKKIDKPFCKLNPQGRILVKTGISLELPIEYITLYGSLRAPINKWHWEELQENVGISAYGVADIHPCSNNLEQKGLFIENKTITGGEVCFIAINHGHEPITITKGDKICQMSLRPLYPSQMEIVEDK